MGETRNRAKKFVRSVITALTAEELARFEGLRQQRGLTQSEALRLLVSRGLDAEERQAAAAHDGAETSGQEAVTVT
jgi:hypothetical protein